MSSFHPNNIHHGGGPLPIQPVNSPLYVITIITNPKRYRTRYDLYRKFEKYIECSGAILYTIEANFGEREFEVTDPSNPRHLQVTTTSEIWHKENMCNMMLAKLPSDWKYVAFIDADVQFARQDWVYETIHLLQHYDIIQMFSQSMDLDPNYQVLGDIREGIISAWINENYGSILTAPTPGGYLGYGCGNRHPGYAWAYTKKAMNHLGGLIDWAIVGSADWHMAAALVGQVDASLSPLLDEFCPTYVEKCRKWQHYAVKELKQNIGFLPTLLYHYWHGKKANRQYETRWKILVDNKFNPCIDLKKDWQGLYQLTDNNINLRNDLRKYFSQRNEDGIDVN